MTHVRSDISTGITAAEHLDAEIAEHAVVAARTREVLSTEFSRLVAACATALRAGHKLVLFGNGGRLAELVDQRIVVPSASTARIQEMHRVLGHALCALLEKDAAQ